MRTTAFNCSGLSSFQREGLLFPDTGEHSPPRSKSLHAFSFGLDCNFITMSCRLSVRAPNKNPRPVFTHLTTDPNESENIGSKPSHPCETRRGHHSQNPTEIIDIDEILDHLSESTDPDSTLSLKACALISKLWVPSCRRYLLDSTQSFSLWGYGQMA